MACFGQGCHTMIAVKAFSKINLDTPIFLNGSSRTFADALAALGTKLSIYGNGQFPQLTHPMDQWMNPINFGVEGFKHLLCLLPWDGRICFSFHRSYKVLDVYFCFRGREGLDMMKMRRLNFDGSDDRNLHLVKLSSRL